MDMYERKVIVIVVLYSQSLCFYFGTGGRCVCVSFLAGQRNNTKLLIFFNVLYNKSHMIDHHGTVHT